MLFHPFYFKFDKKYVLLNLKNELNISDENMSSIEEEEYVDSLMREDYFITEMVENNVNYYIIDKSQNKTMGPYDIKAFNKRKLELKLNFCIRAFVAFHFQKI